MAAPDPGWKDALNYLWAVLLIPVGIVWKKADNAVQREEFEKKNEHWSRHVEKLYQNAEEDRTIVRNGLQDILKEMHAAENRLRDKIEKK